MKLYQFEKFFGRNGTLEGIFIADPIEVNKLIGVNICFGEVLGKHSDVSCIIQKEDIKQLNVLDSTIDDMFKVFGNNVNGYNPLDYLEK